MGKPEQKPRRRAPREARTKRQRALSAFLCHEVIRMDRITGMCSRCDNVGEARGHRKHREAAPLFEKAGWRVVDDKLVCPKHREGRR